MHRKNEDWAKHRLETMLEHDLGEDGDGESDSDSGGTSVGVGDDGGDLGSEADANNPTASPYFDRVQTERETRQE